MVAARIARIEPDVILHLAARSVVTAEAYADPVETCSLGQCWIRNNTACSIPMRGLRGRVRRRQCDDRQRSMRTAAGSRGYRQDEHIHGGRDRYSQQQSLRGTGRRRFPASRTFRATGGTGCQIGLTSARAGIMLLAGATGRRINSSGYHSGAGPRVNLRFFAIRDAIRRLAACS